MRQCTLYWLLDEWWRLLPKKLRGLTWRIGKVGEYCLFFPSCCAQLRLVNSMVGSLLASSSTLLMNIDEQTELLSLAKSPLIVT